MLRTAAASGINPEVFWRLSLREWRLMTATEAQQLPLSRAAFETLVEAWPDE
jgi:uncharacterized phage protein (TIGR02216 family)